MNSQLNLVGWHGDEDLCYGDCGSCRDCEEQHEMRIDSLISQLILTTKEVDYDYQ
jgi:hypothetical protein